MTSEASAASTSASTSASASKSKIVIKRKKLADEYIITTKRVVAKFKYLVTCFDHPDDPTLTGGLVQLPSAQLVELLSDQNVELDSSSESGFFSQILKEMREWHPAISRIEVDLKNIHEIDNLHDYKASHQHIRDALSSLDRNTCIKTEQHFHKYLSVSHRVVDIKVSFQLIRKINKIEEFPVNFKYAHKLLAGAIDKWNRDKTQKAYLDEVSVKLNQLPYAEDLKYTSDEDDDICYVYPYVNLIPLHPIVA